MNKKNINKNNYKKTKNYLKNIKKLSTDTAYVRSHHSTTTTSLIIFASKTRHKEKNVTLTEVMQQKTSVKKNFQRFFHWLFKRKYREKNISDSIIIVTLLTIFIFGALSTVYAIENHACFIRDNFDSCHTLNESPNGTTPDFLCVWCEYWCVHNAKELQSGACQEYSHMFAQVFDLPKIDNVQPKVILRDTPTLISIMGNHFDKYTSPKIYNTVTDVKFTEYSQNIEKRNHSVVHTCMIHSKNFTEIRCVLEGITDNVGQVNIELRFYYERVIYESSDKSYISYNYTAKVLNDHNLKPELDKIDGDKNNAQFELFGLTSSQIIIGSSFTLGVSLACISCIAYSRRAKIANLSELFTKKLLIRDIRKELIKQELLIELESCQFLSKLGNGQFGHVFAASVSSKQKNHSKNKIIQSKIGEEKLDSCKISLQNQSVAIKQLNSVKADTQTIRMFVNEGIKMSKIHHENILTPLGITFDAYQIDSQTIFDNDFDKEQYVKKNKYENNEEKINVDRSKIVKMQHIRKWIYLSSIQPSIILPIMVNGDLCRYLRSHKLFSIQSLVNFTRQIADGMVYLSSMKIVHGDLASRNCLLDQNLVIKIADFGFTRRMYNQEYSVQNRSLWPVRWMSPEQLTGIADQQVKFTFNSDIWAFGVVMWEIFTLGSHPYDELNDSEIPAKLRSGFRLAPPVNCPDNILKLMHKCWNISPDQRPNFLQIFEHLVAIESSIIKPSSTHSSSSLSFSSSLAHSFSSSPTFISHSDFSWKEKSTLSEKISVQKNNFETVPGSILAEEKKNFRSNFIRISTESPNVTNYTTLPDRCFANHEGRTLTSVVSY